MFYPGDVAERPCRDATDAGWSAGEGPREVRGPVGDLLLLATGREAGVEGLTRPGVGEAAASLHPLGPVNP